METAAPTAAGTRVKAMNTDDLLWLNTSARNAGRNRKITPESYDSIDPDGTHIVWMEMPHRDGAEMRLFLQVKVKGTDDPAEAVIDVTWDQWKSIATIEKQEDGSWQKVAA